MSEAIVARLGEIAFLAESTKGTKATVTLTGAHSKLRAYDMKWEPDVRIFERATLSATMSSYPHLVGQCLARLTFKTELRKTAVTATEDFWGDLLNGSGFKFTNTGIYNMSSVQSDHKTLTMYAFLGSNGGSGTSGCVRVGMRGAMGTTKLVGKVGEPAMWEHTFLGYHDPADATLKPVDDALNTITHETAIPAIFQGTTFTIGGVTRYLSTLSLDFGQVIVPRDSVASTNGGLHMVCTGRQVTGTVDPDMELVATADDLGSLNLGTQYAISCTLTQAATASPSVNARTIVIALPVCQHKAAPPGERNGIGTVGLEFIARKSAEPGDDEVTVTLTGV